MSCWFWQQIVHFNFHYTFNLTKHFWPPHLLLKTFWSPPFSNSKLFWPPSILPSPPTKVFMNTPLKAFSWETDLSVTLGDFTVKKRKIRKGKSVFNWKSIKLERNVLCCRYLQLYVSHMCNRIFIFELELSSYWPNIKFSRNCPNSTFSHKS